MNGQEYLHNIQDRLVARVKDTTYVWPKLFYGLF